MLKYFSFIDNFFFEVNDSLKAGSVSVLNMEADEFEFYSETNQSMFSTSQIMEHI